MLTNIKAQETGPEVLTCLTHSLVPLIRSPVTHHRPILYRRHILAQQHNLLDPPALLPSPQPDTTECPSSAERSSPHLAVTP